MAGENEQSSKQGDGASAALTADQQAQLNDTIAQLPNSVGAAVQNGVNAAIQAQNAKNEEAQAAAAKAGRHLSAEEVDELKNSEFAGHLLEKVEDLLKPQNELIAAIAGKQNDNAVTAELQKASDAHEDFWEWKAEMGEINKATPGLSVERMYLLARMENPKKAAEIDKAKEDTKENTKTQEAAPRFGGLTTTSTLGDGSDVGKMSKADAVEAAWNEVMGSLPPGMLT